MNIISRGVLKTLGDGKKNSVVGIISHQMYVIVFLYETFDHFHTVIY